MTKISDLSALTGASVDAANDLVEIVDASEATPVDRNKKITVAELKIAINPYSPGGTDVAVADGGTGSSTAGGARTNLGATTVGANLFTLTDPTAITFLRVNADNSVTALSASAFRTAIGAGTGSGSGDMVAANNLSDVASPTTSRTNLGVGTGDSPQFTGLNVGHASDTTVTRTGAGDIAVEGNAIYRAGGTDVPLTDGGTGASSASAAWANLLQAAAASDINTGTDTTKALTADALAGSNLGKAVFQVWLSDLSTAITTGDGKAYLVIPAALNGMDLVAVKATLVVAQSSSGIPTVQIANVTDSVDMLSTKLTIDASETDSSTAAAAAVIDTSKDDVATGDILRFDIDVAGTGAKGLVVTATFQLP